jgi:hypothetical protein
VVDALRTSIFLSRMRGFKWKRCARHGCNQLFEQDTKHQKIYCTPECAHLQAVNNYNAKQKKRAPKPKTKERKVTMSKEILSKDQIKEIAGVLAKNPVDSRNLQAQLSAAPKEKQRAMKTCLTVMRRAERLIKAEQKAKKGR